MNHNEVEALFTDWVDAEFYIISDTSGDIERDARAFLDRAGERAQRIGIQGFLSEHVKQSLELWDDNKN